MSFFDSAKNSALWEKEMTGLRSERERRKTEGFKGEQPENEEKAAKIDRTKDSRHRHITIEELEKIEAEISGIKRVRRPIRERQHSMEMKQPEKSGPKK